MTLALFLFSLSPLEIGESGDGVVGSGWGRGCIVFNYKEWLIKKGVVESEKTGKKKDTEKMKFPQNSECKPFRK